jgi:hypothetical protein
LSSKSVLVIKALPFVRFFLPFRFRKKPLNFLRKHFFLFSEKIHSVFLFSTGNIYVKQNGVQVAQKLLLTLIHTKLTLCFCQDWLLNLGDLNERCCCCSAEEAAKVGCVLPLQKALLARSLASKAISSHKVLKEALK